MLLEQKIITFSTLGEYLLEKDNFEQIKDWARKARNENPWFTEDNVLLSLNNIALYYLDRRALDKFVANYEIRNLKPEAVKNVGVVMAGNIPAVGFHDLLCVLLSGHNLAVKLSSSDSVIMKKLIEKLIEINPEFNNLIQLTDRMNNIDALIATGSDNTAKHFEYYFAKKPHIIRKNRTSAAILRGDENRIDLSTLGNDIFQYFGLGCRNVSKLYVPEGYTFDKMYESIEYWNTILLHNKYQNNYDYNKSIYLVNRTPFLDNGFLLIKEDTALVSPISVIFYETYANETQLKALLAPQKDKLQCLISKDSWLEGSLNFGEAQSPRLADFADNVDTMEFLINL